MSKCRFCKGPCRCGVMQTPHNHGKEWENWRRRRCRKMEEAKRFRYPFELLNVVNLICRQP